ncbi:MAG TPA: phosphoesterase [Gemmataceae bacterium]|jgi:predicted NUDIX family phosphoesterase|nr:phosphoesterase [Gemmataceae bacterium]
MDAKKAAEEVLGVPASRLAAAGDFHGFRPFDEAMRQLLLDPAHVSYRPRGEAEVDPSFKQLIPYVVLRCGAELFHYTRGASGAETRLRALRSVGLGGHISREDGPPDADPYRAGMLRELNEEVEIQGSWTERPLGFIYDGRTPVGQVHIGIVHLIDLEEPLARPREAAIDEAGFAPLPDLFRRRDAFETWSQFVLEELSLSTTNSGI